MYRSVVHASCEGTAAQARDDVLAAREAYPAAGDVRSEGRVKNADSNVPRIACRRGRRS